jgi:hypothetical protein
MKAILALFMAHILGIRGLFWNIPFGPRIQITDIKNRITKRAPNIKGFYGLIGPNIDIQKDTTLYELFTGDGVVQGAFFEKDKFTFVKHHIRTDKLLYEHKNGRIPENMFVKMLFMAMEKVNILPNILGLANTALLNVRGKIYALYERDVPYLIDVDFDSKEVHTVKKVNIPGLSTFSAHSKYTEQGVETLDYSVLGKYVNYVRMDDNMNVLYKKRISMDYLPVVHDFLSTNKSVVLCDAPIAIDPASVFKSKTPVRFDISKKTRFRVLSRESSQVDTYICDSAFYVFHYTCGCETDDTIEFFAPIYENLDFNKLNIHGKYRKVILDKRTKRVTIENNPLIDVMNLDFPVQYKNLVVLRNVENGAIREFVLCDKLKIIHRFQFKNKNICGEPAVVKGSPFLVFFANDPEKQMSYFMILNLETYDVREIPTGFPSLHIGFHSLYLAG